MIGQIIQHPHVVRALKLVTLVVLSCVLWVLVAGAALAQTFQLSGVTFSKSDYLTDAELQGAVAPYLNRDIEFADVEKMISAVQGLYLRRGVVTAQAIIEPQEVSDGILKVTLVEAALEDIEVVGMKDTRPDFVLRRLSAQTGEKPDFDKLARDLRLFEIAHDIRPKLSFSPGTVPGTTRAVITVDEPKKWSWIASYDNSASEALGEHQLSFSGTVRSLTGHRDTLTARLSFTEGSEAISFYYNRPVGLRGASVGLSASYTQSEIVQGEFSIINVESEDLKVSTGYSRPFWVGRDRYWTFSADLNYETSSSVVAGTALQSNDLKELDLGIGYRLQKPGQAWSFAGGIKAGSVNSGSVSLSDGSYTLLYGKVSHARRLGTRYVFDANLELQYAEGQNLSVRRRISAGGISSLRGYPKDVRTGDSGAILRLQVSCPAPCFSEAASKIGMSPFGFIDLGYIKPFDASLTPVDTSDSLMSVGAGMRMNYKNLDLLGFVGIPVVDTAGLNDDKLRVYIGADYSF